MAMGNRGFLLLEMNQEGEIVERLIDDKTPIEWLEENYAQPEAVDYIQTDMAVDKDTIHELTGTRAEINTDVAAMTYDYPRGISVKINKDEEGHIKAFSVGEIYTLGTIFATEGEEAEIVEYRERGNTLQDRVMKTLYGVTDEELNTELKRLEKKEKIDIAKINAQPKEKRERILRDLSETLQKGIDKFVDAHKGSRPAEAPSLQGNVGAYSVKWHKFKDTIQQRTLKPHIQWKKKQQLADNSEIDCETSELFATDLKLNRVLSVPVQEAIPAKDPAQFAACRDALSQRHEKRLRTEFDVTQIGKGAVIEFSPLFKGHIDNSLRVGNGAKLYLGGSGAGNGFEIQIGKDVEIAGGTTVIIEGNGPVTIQDGVKFSGGGTIRIQASQDGQDIIIGGNIISKADLETIVSEQGITVAAKPLKQAVADAVRRTFVSVGKPITLLPYSDGLGGTYTGVAQIVTFMLKSEGRELLQGKEYFVEHAQIESLIDAICAQDPYVKKEVVALYVDDGRGGSKMQECTRYYNTLYRKILNERRNDVTDQEIDYMLQNLADNSVVRYLIMYLRGIPIRAAADEQRQRAKISAHADDARRAAWETRAQAAGEETERFSALWKRVEQRAEALQGTLTNMAMVAWRDIQGTYIDMQTGLPLGNPDRKPFSADLNIEKTHESAVKINEDIIGRIVATVSGIRGPYGDLFGDLPLPPTFSGRHFDCGTVPIPAALVSAATQVELLKRMIDDPQWFVEQIPLSAMKGDTDEEKKNNLENTKKRCLELLQQTQKKKDKLRDPHGAPLRKPKFVIIRDTRSTGDALADVDIRAGLAMGVDVEYGEIASVTAAANYVRSSNDVDVGIYISASHNPESDNGLKILLGDGRVAPSELAYPFIYVFRQLLKEKKQIEGKEKTHTEEIIKKVNSVSADSVRQAIEAGVEVNRKIKRMEKEYLRKLVTGCINDNDAMESMRRSADIVRKARLAVILERNGSSGDISWLEDFGFLVEYVNERYRYDMNHPLCPYPAAVAEANPRVEETMAGLAELGFETYLVQDPDTDADRSLFQVIDPKGSLFVRQDHVERTFIPTCVNIVLNGENWDFDNSQPRQDQTDPVNPEKNRIMAFCVNDPSSIGMEMAADVMGFIVLRRQVGEANIADGMTDLRDMKWGQAKKLADEHGEWIYIPRKLREQFADPRYDNCPITSLGGGEASNGSFFNLQALVRDPANHLGSYLKILDPIEGKRRVREIFRLFGKIERFDEDWWKAGQLRYLPYRMLQVLPPTRDQDFFAAKGTAQIENPPIPLLGKVSDHLDSILDKGGHINNICEALANIWKAHGVQGAIVEPVFLNLDDKSYVGVGNYQKKVPIGMQPRGGGYEVIFVLKVNGNTYPFSWGWKRGSLTESRLTRTGPSAAFPIQAVLTGDVTSIGRLEEEKQQQVVDECYSLIELQFTGVALRRAMAFAAKECLEVKPGAIPATTQDYINALNGGEPKFFQMQKNLRNHMENENAMARNEVKEAQHLVGSDVIERVRFAFLVDALDFDDYYPFLIKQSKLAHGLRIQEFIGEYIKEALAKHASDTYAGEGDANTAITQAI